MSRDQAHTEPGILHLAVAVLLQGEDGRLLLQLRKHLLFDHLWDITGATHPLVRDGQQESLEAAVRRCIRSEWNVELATMREVARFNYYAEAGALCEKEHCVTFSALAVGEPRHDPDSAYEAKWISSKSFPEMVERSPSDFTPWAVEVARRWRPESAL